MPRVGLISSVRRALGRRGTRDGAHGPAPPLMAGPAPALAGFATDGSAVEVSPAEIADLDLLFLTSDCRECRDSWSSAAAGVVIVTPDPATDSPRAVARLAPAGATVVMSSQAWHAYGVTKSPWRVQVRAGQIVSAGPAA